jgi:hypothetical protein
MRRVIKIVLSILGGAIVSLVVGLVLAALSSSGVINMQITHALLWIAFGISAVAAPLSMWLICPSWRYCLSVFVVTGLMVGGGLWRLDSWLTQQKLQQDAINIPPASPYKNPPQPNVPITKTPKPKPQVQIEQHGNGTGAIGGNVTQGPCSNLTVGGTGNQQTTNCQFDTPPRSMYVKVIERSVPSLVSVKIWVDRDFPNAKFVVLCDRPCKAVEAKIDREGHRMSAMIGPEAEPVTVPGITDAAFVVDHPEVMGPDVSLIGVIKSEDGSPLKIIGIRPLTIIPPR